MPRTKFYDQRRAAIDQAVTQAVGEVAAAAAKAAVPRRPDDWLTPAEVVAQYRIGKATLARWRRDERPPAFRRLGRAVHYRRVDVEEFVAARTAGRVDSPVAMTSVPNPNR